MSIQRLRTVMRRLRDPETGCEWDRVQTHRSIARYAIEEAYEVVDAIERDDMDELVDELGDLQLQVVFHAQMASERGDFTFDDVVDRICDKMERRHPHIFGDDPEGGHHRWEEIKAAERAGKPDQSALAGVARALPALERAQKLQKRAARTGFDWPDATGAREKIDEELLELESAEGAAHREEELGDLLFAVVNLARFLSIDAEDALRKATAKFEKRFRTIEAHPDFSTTDLDGKEELWRAAKRALET
ncbi:nucleoside triphosphate pyrophosphohydrolase [Sphingomicrobium sp. XHP0235]|uniref:nucleoside triphosphate pyrophosphohydrolase n=1 Tax=Sphingomicrobium aquimarinum TaxID=3133971 RepID=UPI0031FE46BD